MAKKFRGWDDEFEDNQPQEAEEKSKSELKREMLALQRIGEELVNLPNSQLEQVPLEETLREAIALARRLKHREGRRRQMQYIGKLMRTADMETINQKLDFFRNEGETYKRHFHRVEKWRDKLLKTGDDGLNELIAEMPELNRQHLRQLIRQAQKELSQNKPPAASRKLFKYLHEAIQPE